MDQEVKVQAQAQVKEEAQQEVQHLKQDPVHNEEDKALEVPEENQDLE
jgi:hypothetical protein